MLGQLTQSYEYGRKAPVVILAVLLILSFVCQQFSLTNSVSPIRPYMVLIAVCTFVLMIFSLSRGRAPFFRLNGVDYGLLVFYGFMALSSIYGDNFMLSARMLVGLLLLSVAYVVVRIILVRPDNYLIANILLISGKWFVLLSLALYLLGFVAYYFFGVASIADNFDGRTLLLGVYFENGGWPRLRGVCDSPNNFGLYAVMLLSAFLSFGLKKNKVYIILLIGMVFLTLSYTAYLALTTMLLIYFLSIGVRSLFTFGFLVIYSIPFCMFLFAEFTHELHDYFSVVSPRLLTGSGRFELWAYSFSEFLHKPVFGYGLNQARDVLVPLREVKSTHNNFLEVLLEGGIVGFSCYLFSVALVFIHTFRLGVPRVRRWAWLCLGGLFIFSNSNVTLYADSTILFLAVLASFKSSKHNQEFRNLNLNR